VSYDASICFECKRFGKYEVMLEGGSYNPGNQPAYGSDWEYYDVFVYKDSDVGMDKVSRKTFTNKDKALIYYKQKVNEYKTKG